MEGAAAAVVVAARADVGRNAVVKTAVVVVGAVAIVVISVMTWM